MNAGEFVRAFSRQPFIFGISDCAAMVDDWVAHRTGRRPSDASGQKWATQDEAAQLLSTRALPFRLAQAMKAAGLRTTSVPRDGDVAAIAAGNVVTCAVRVGSFWMFRHGEGLCGVSDPRILMAWRVG